MKIPRYKQRSLLDVMADYKLNLYKQMANVAPGAHLMIKCPFTHKHRDTAPSFAIYNNVNEPYSWFCYGHCSRGGGAWEFVKRMEEDLSDEEINIKVASDRLVIYKPYEKEEISLELFKKVSKTLQQISPQDVEKRYRMLDMAVLMGRRDLAIKSLTGIDKFRRNDNG